MSYTTLITAEQLQALIRDDAPLMVFDCSFDLTRPESGAELFGSAHIPGAVHADLDLNLSATHGRPGKNGQVVVAHDDGEPASGGRHPLPSREKFAAWLSSIGFTNAMQAVVYDRNGSLYCGRLWWMLKWMGHEAVAVLDGGLQAWQAAASEVSSGEEVARFQSNFVPSEPRVALVSRDEVAAQLGRPSLTLVDARGASRYRGESETTDPRAGHIPGALNRPYTENFAADGKFKSAAQLRSEFESLLAGRAAGSVVNYCGSGVSATPNVLAMEIAGLGASGLYAGSWSDWSSAAELPIETGAAAR